EALRIHFVALIRGMPLKIRPIATPYPGDNPAGGGPVQGRNEASIDSELSALGFLTRQISGAVTNPYFQGFRPIAEVTAAPLLLVTRLDAPDSATVRQMITDAIEAEKNGLWGRAFVDGTHETSGGRETAEPGLRTFVNR